MGIYTIELTTEQEKALLTDMISIQDWLNNAIYNKARQMVDKVCNDAVAEQTHTILTLKEKKDISALIASQGGYFFSVKQMPENIKLEIVKRAKVKLAAERQAEFEASMKSKPIP